MLVNGMFRRLIRSGTFLITDTKGRTHRFEGERSGPSAHVRFHDPRMEYRLLWNGSLTLGEGYMNGWWTVVDGSLYDCLDVIGRNVRIAGMPKLHALLQKLTYPARYLQQLNIAPRAKRNVAHHYDLSGELYNLFLDSDRQYSCAYFRSPDDTLEIAQENKKRHIAAKLRLEPGQKVLDIGCGWGGLALHLARNHDVEVTGLTLSTEQLAVANERARASGLDGRVKFHLRDYRDQDGTFDRIVSVGMFEHVGITYYPTYFNAVKSLLAEDGVALLHTIGRMEGPSTTDPWIRRYIFPGGYLPAPSELTGTIERSGLWLTDLEILRIHYAKTLRIWRERFLANKDKALALYDERFCRMWEYYLAICEISFRHLRNTVFQAQLTRSQDAVPLTRDYMKECVYVGGNSESAV
ncbi:MAG: cyclopropane-fatty-acyl-phospholipid synthase family protein [Rhodospirillales bacterium]